MVYNGVVYGYAGIACKKEVRSFGMRNKKRAAAAVTLAAAMACGTLAGCSFVSTDTQKDYLQVIAEVNIAQSADFQEGGVYADYADAISTTEIIKRDMIATFISSGYSAMQTYGWTYADTFSSICESLVNREIFMQYAIVYFLSKGEDADGNTFGLTEYLAAVKKDEEEGTGLGGLGYFLTDEEEALALYETRVLFNNTLDTKEADYIESTDSASSVTVRTLPTGVNTANEDYYDPAYKIYIGSNSASDCGTYETVEGSTPTTRRKAYNSFLANLRSNDLLQNNEDTSDFESLAYFATELKSEYEAIIINKLNELFEKEAAEVLTEEWLTAYYNDMYNNQSVTFADDKSAFETAFNAMSDSNFVLTAPAENYGFVINILLPFSKTQSDLLSGLTGDYQDTKGNKYVQRARLLQNVRATDQRETWFTGSTDYSYETNGGYTGTLSNSAARTYLFFEECLQKDADKTASKYELLKNYYGEYTYNGSVVYNKDKDTYVLDPTPISIDDFIAEMEGYLNYAFGATVASGEKTQENYYDRSVDAYYKDSESGKVVDYSSFVYYTGAVEFSEAFDANRMFVAGTEENKAFSVINELSFAYNTDTAGLNPYLGYSVVVDTTSYVGEFEYAAQEACRRGAGSYVVTPSDYGWHVIYCTFSFREADGSIKPFTFDYSQIADEGTFSYYFYEAIKEGIVSKTSSTKQTEAINAYKDCVTLYESRYANLMNLDS